MTPLFWRFLRILVWLLVMAFLSGLISRWLAWLNAQEDGTRDVVLYATAVAIALIGAGLSPLLKWAAEKVQRRWAQSTATAVAQRGRMTLRPEITLQEAEESEPGAFSALSDCIGRLNTLRVAFTNVIDGWPEEIKRVANVKPDQVAQAKEDLLNRQAAALSKYTGQMNAELAKFRSARKRLTNSWISRMYWHEHRGTATDIAGISFTRTQQLAASVERTTDHYKNQLVYMPNVFQGRNPAMDAALEKFLKSTKAQLEENVELEWLWATVLAFKKRHAGIRGLFRRVVLKKKW